MQITKRLLVLHNNSLLDVKMLHACIIKAIIHIFLESNQSMELGHLSDQQ